MKKEICSEKLDHLLENFNSKVKQKAMQLYNCNGIDAKAYKDDNYLLPKLLMIAAIRSCLSNERVTDKRELENLKHF